MIGGIQEKPAGVEARVIVSWMYLSAAPPKSNFRAGIQPLIPA
jgi:hypothetical protein